MAQENPLDSSPPKRDTHPLENLITGPLQALVRAQAFTTETMMEYIYSLTDGGILKAKDLIENKQALPLKNIEFLLQRAEQDDQGKMENKKYILQVPLMTMLPIPYLTIKEAELNLNFKVVDVTKHDETKEKTDVETKGFLKNNVIQTRYTSSKAGSKEATSDISLKITISQTDVPMGLAKFLTSASNSIIEKSKEE